MEEADFNEFKARLDGYTPLISDAILDHYMEKCGITTKDENVKKVIALMSHKFLTDVAIGAFQFHKIHTKAAQKDKRFGREKKLTLQLSDLQRSLEDMGIDISRPYYYM